MIKNKLPSDQNQCDIQNEIAREQDISSRGKQKYDSSITTMQMCLVQMIDGRLKQSRPGNARYNVGGMSISGWSKLEEVIVRGYIEEKWSQQSHELTFVVPKTRRRREMEGYRQRRVSKGDQWQSGGIDMIPTNQIASRVDGDPKSDV